MPLNEDQPTTGDSNENHVTDFNDSVSRLISADPEKVRRILSQARLISPAERPSNELTSLVRACSEFRDGFQDIPGDGFRFTPAVGPRPALDIEMVQRFCRAIDQLAEKYATIRKLTDEDSNDHDQDRISKIRDEYASTVVFCEEEKNLVLDFLAMARVAAGLGRASGGSYVAMTAAELVLTALQELRKWWNDQIRARRSDVLDLRPTRVRCSIGSIPPGFLHKWPSPDELRILVREEAAAADIYFRERFPIDQASALSPTSEPIKVSNESPPAPLMSIDHWSELAIGIDEHWNYWAVTPVPDFGEEFSKSNATQLHLAGERWKVLLDLLSRSSTGRTATVGDLIMQLGYLPPRAMADVDRRVRPGEIQTAQTADLRKLLKPASNRLNSALGDLRRELRRLVNCPMPASKQCLRRARGSLHVDAVFVTACLVRQTSGELLFGGES